MVTPCKIPGDPMRTRHVIRIATDPTHVDHQGNKMLMEHDTQTVLKWLAGNPGSGLTSQQWRDYTDSLNWTKGYRKAIADLVRENMVTSTQETVEQTRARLVTHAEEIRQQAMESMQLVAALGAVKLQAEMLLPKEQQQQTVTHRYVIEAPAIATSPDDWAKTIKAERIT